MPCYEMTHFPNAYHFPVLLLLMRAVRTLSAFALILCSLHLSPFPLYFCSACSVLFLHPVHNFAILQYDPALIGSTPVTEVDLAAASTSATASRALTLLSPTGASAGRARAGGLGGLGSISGSGGGSHTIGSCGSAIGGMSDGSEGRGGHQAVAGAPSAGQQPGPSAAAATADATQARPSVARSRSSFREAGLFSMGHGMDMAHTMALDSHSHNHSAAVPVLAALPPQVAQAAAVAAVSVSTAAGPGYAPSPMHKGKIEHGIAAPPMLSLGGSAAAAVSSPVAAEPPLPVPAAVSRLRGVAASASPVLAAASPAAGSAAHTPSHGSRTAGTAGTSTGATFTGMQRVPHYPGTASGGASGALRVGDEVLFVGLTASQMPVVQKATITKSERLITVDSSPPRYREHNAECLHVDRLAVCLGGVFVKAALLQQPFEAHINVASGASAGTGGGSGGSAAADAADTIEEPPVTVGALWASYAYTDTSDGSVHESSLAMPADIVADVVRPLRASAALLRQHSTATSASGTMTAGITGASIVGRVAQQAGPAQAGAESVATGTLTAAAAAARVLLPQLRSLDTEWKGVPLSKARQGLGLSPAWVARLEAVAGSKRHVLAVRRCLPRSHAHTLLKEGDIVLAVNGRPVLTARDVEIAVQYTRPLQVQGAQAAATGSGGDGSAAVLSPGLLGGAGAGAGAGAGKGRGAEPVVSRPGASGALLEGGQVVGSGGAAQAALSGGAAGGGGVGTGSADARSGGAGVSTAAPAAGLSSDSEGRTSGPLPGAASAGSGASAATASHAVPLLATATGGPTVAAGTSAPGSAGGLLLPGPLTMPAAGSSGGGAAAGSSTAGTWVPEPQEPVALTILREGVESTVLVRPSLLRGFGTDRIIVWCGIMVQAAHEPVEARGFLPDPSPGGNPPYVSRWQYGSPAHKGGVRATQWVTEVNGAPVRDLDGFLEAIRGIGDRTDVRLRCVDLQVRSDFG